MDEDPPREDARQQLFEYAALGKEIDSFWRSSVGKYLLLRTDSEYVTAMGKLEDCDATDFKLIVRLQGEAWRAKSFRGWMNEAIQTGLMAENTLEGRDDGSEENG